MDEKSALEEIQYIKNVIAETKKNMLHNGMDYIFWGIIVTIGMLTQYIMLLNRVSFSYMLIWAVLIPIGWMYSIYNSRKMNRKHPRTYSGKIIAHVWIAAGIAATMVGFVAVPLQSISPMAICPLISVIVGAAYFVSGIVIDSKWFTNLAYGWWTGAIIMFIVKDAHQFLIMALIMLFFQTIPGIILYKKYKKEVALVS